MGNRSTSSPSPMPLAPTSESLTLIELRVISRKLDALLDAVHILLQLVASDDSGAVTTEAVDASMRQLYDAMKEDIRRLGVAGPEDFFTAI